MSIELIIAILGSSGCVALINQIFQSVRERRQAKEKRAGVDLEAMKEAVETLQTEQKTQNRALRGILHDILIRECTAHLYNQGIAADALDDLRKYYYEPYISLGGNGTVEALYERTEKLPIIKKEV